MKKYFYTMVFISLMVLPLSGADDDESTLTNTAQAQKAENLAQASEEAAQQEAQAAQDNLDTAQSEYDNAVTALEADPENLQLQEAVSLAEQNLNDATATLSSISGVSVESINEMRASGMGWGEIAHELGVHPSVLGLGQKNRIENQERVRDMKSFKTENKKSSNDNQGLKGKAQKDKSDKGNSSSKGKSSGKGNSNGKGKD